MRRRTDHEPSVSTDAGALARLTEPSGAHPYLTPPEPSDAWWTGKVLLGLIVLAGGVYEIDKANGGHLYRRLFTPGLSCLDPGVVKLARQVLREQLPNAEVGVGVNAAQTGITLDAIRTRSTEGGGVSCAARAKLDLAYTELFRAVGRAREMELPPTRELEISYRAEVTDDHEHVYVTLKIGDE